MLDCVIEVFECVVHDLVARGAGYFNAVVNCAGPLVDAYPVGDDYQATYNSFRSALSANAEVIFMKEYEKDVFMHATVDYTSSSTPISGITKDAFDAYLFKDGKPKGLTEGAPVEGSAGIVPYRGGVGVVHFGIHELLDAVAGDRSHGHGVGALVGMVGDSIAI